MERTPDDPNDEPTQMADYDYRGAGRYDEPAGYYSEYRDPTGSQPGWSEPPEPPPAPWYLRPLALIGWGVLTALLIATLVWSMVRLVNKDSGDTTPATTSVTSTVAPPGESPAQHPGPVAPAPSGEEEAPPPDTTTTEPPTTTTEPPTTTTEPTTTTTAPTTTQPTTTQAPTTQPTTTAPPTTTEAPPTTTAAADGQ
ncbi:hypothetical protein [Mycolicibacter senuensis]|uniref:Uncharacterized protein n=1 Tax=Mycolicibacter senuensis TaxID=386913 RepID=A0A7I9XPG6_9MYCO|nr:hypothetical protein [Mycolicibacter senuensis]ORW64395.1 hypothetical protein AWC24_20630 [Mycolicibacter senuensis]GFG71865.1 hypothetical protein MSEN_35850 [Mycolicibacter senuensis]